MRYHGSTGSRVPQFWAALLAMGVAWLLPAQAGVTLPKVFGSHMVLQRGVALPVWGWAGPGEAVAVEIGGVRRETKANAQGEWRVDLPAMEPGEARTMTVQGSDTVRFEDILVGEVWVCSGQSNMEMGIAVCNDAEREVAAADLPQIRLFAVPKKVGAQPERDVAAAWKVCSPATVAEGGWGGFSGAAYYFGRDLHQSLSVPVGLIMTCWGGTRIEPWTPPAGFAAVPALKSLYDGALLADPRTEQHKQRLGQTLKEMEDWLAAARKALADEAPVPVQPTVPKELQAPQGAGDPTGLYNAMIHPLVPFAIRGAIWYQGESNHNEGRLYTEKTKALVGGWREVWKQGDLPFYYVQIAPFEYGNENPTVLAEFWEAQTAALAIPGTGMAVIYDVGDYKDIHPRNKQAVGHRLALLALARTYGRPATVCSGPVFKSMAVEGSKARLTFDSIGGGLVARDGKPLTWFELVDAEEGGFVPAQAEIDGATVVVSAPQVRTPAAVRFGWHKGAEPNLSNRDGLPAVQFSSGPVPRRDSLGKVPEAAGYRLVYECDPATVGREATYTVDKRAEITGAFDRVAYFLELQGAEGQARYVFASMDAFTDDVGKIGIPTLQSKAVFHQAVTRLNVVSNVEGLTTGTDLTGGWIEFWTSNYGTPNAKAVPGASATTYDAGDEPSAPEDGYGCLQVHNTEAKQTVLAVNHWVAGTGCDVGIGNRPEQHPDWTFAGNGGSYVFRRLRVFVHLK